MHKTIYEGVDLSLDVYTGNHKKSVVTFEARNRSFDSINPGAFRSGFGKGLFYEQGFNEFIVKTSRNHWYQTYEILEIAQIINRLTKGTRVITYGGSMGAFAAINFSALLKADIFIALSPLHDVNNGNEAEEKRWSETSTLSFPYNFISSGFCKNSKGYVFYAAEGPDDIHAKLIQRDTNAKLMPLEFGSHPCSFYLNEAYGLKRLFFEIADNTFDKTDFYSVLTERTKETFYPFERDGVQLFRAGNISEAIELMKIAISKKPTLERLHNRLGDYLLKHGSYEAAEAAFLSSIALMSTSSYPYFRLSHVRSAQGDYNAAVSYMDEAIRVDPKLAEYHIRRGNLLSKKQDLQAAEEAYLSAIKLRMNQADLSLKSPTVADLYNRVGDSLLMRGSHPAAEAAFRNSIELEPTSSYPYFRLSHVRAALGDHDAAVSYMDEAIRQDPNLADYHIRRGNLLSKTQYLPAAEDAYLSAIRIKMNQEEISLKLPTIADLYNRVGDSLLKRGNYEAADDAFRSSINLAPANAYPYLRLSHVKAAQDDYISAISLMDEAIRIDPKPTDYHIRRAELITAMQDNSRLRKMVVKTMKSNRLGMSVLGTLKVARRFASKKIRVFKK